jgi:plasmid maintenance system killer protein
MIKTFRCADTEALFNQFRICFRWVGGDAEDVEIVDYH